MINSVVFQNALNRVPEDVKIQVDLSMGIADRIVAILKAKNLTQKEFARLMGKTEAEVSRWVGGTHNFTLSTLAKISAVLATPLIGVSKDYIIQEETPVFVAEEESERENSNDNDALCYDDDDYSWVKDSSEDSKN